LGLVTPVVGVIVGGTLLTDGHTTIGSVVGLGSMILVIVAFIVGLVRRHDVLRSYGLGGLVAYAIAALIGLLLFGACLVNLTGTNLPWPLGN
jgi:hypothetical protein